MRKYAALPLTVLLMVGFFLSLPAFVGKMVTPVSLLHPIERTLSRDISVSGTVEAKGSRDVSVQLPLVPERVEVEVGDSVEANQCIASVDQAATRAALFNLIESASLLPEEYVAAMGSIQEYKEISLLHELGLDGAAVESLIPSEILAPAEGTVTALSLTPGGVAQPGTAVCTISMLSELRVFLSVEEGSAAAVSPGDRVVFKAAATGEEKYAGTVTKVFPTASKTLVGTSQQTMVGVYASIQGDTSRLKPGYTVDGVIKEESGGAVLCVPYEAVLQDEANQEYVYLWERSRAVRRNVATGEEFSDCVAVTKGLSKGDLVVRDASSVPGEGRLLLAG